MSDPKTRHSYNAKTYLEWLLLGDFAQQQSVEVRQLLGDFFTCGIMWGACKLEPEKEFYLWLDLREEEKRKCQK